VIQNTEGLENHTTPFSIAKPRKILGGPFVIAFASMGVFGMAAGAETDSKLYDEVVAKLVPVQGFQSKIKLGGSVVGLVTPGVINPRKFEAIYQRRGGLPDDLTTDTGHE